MIFLSEFSYKPIERFMELPDIYVWPYVGVDHFWGLRKLSDTDLPWPQFTIDMMAYCKILRRHEIEC